MVATTSGKVLKTGYSECSKDTVDMCGRSYICSLQENEGCTTICAKIGFWNKGLDNVQGQEEKEYDIIFR
jgi:hypothetical protein